MTIIVDGRGVAKHWHDETGLAALDFTVATGTMTCVKGRSGSGKSTLLALLADLADPDEGELQWLPAVDAAARHDWSTVALIPQTMLLLTELTAIENVALGGASLADAGAVLDDLGLIGLHTRTIDTLSMGQRQRVAVARSIVVHPTLLLADEPTSHQDARSAQVVLDSLRLEADRGAAVVIASHDPAAVAACDSVIDLDR